MGELFRLLDQLGVEGMSDADAWKRVSVVRNWGVVPTNANPPGEGFKLLVLDANWRPAWFGRCSWATQEQMVRETALLDALTRDAVAQAHVPESRFANSPTLFVQLSRHLGVKPYRDTLARRTPSTWAGDVVEAVTMAGVVMGRASVLAPQLMAAASPDRQQSAFEVALATVARAGKLDPSDSRVLEQAFHVAGDLPGVLQHGDLWPGNLLRAHGRWWLIDFAECGHVVNPLYDVFHMLHAAPPSAEATWYARAANADGRDAWRTARAGVLEHFARARGLNRREVGACLVYYLVHLTAYRLRPGVGAEWSVGLLRDVARVAAYLRQSGSLETLFD